MKKWVRIIALILTIFLCLPLTGCNALDEMRQQQGIWQDDGTIIWNGSEYKWLNTNELSLNLERDEEYSHAYITKPDVPVLLSSSIAALPSSSVRTVRSAFKRLPKRLPRVFNCGLKV